MRLLLAVFVVAFAGDVRARVLAPGGQAAHLAARRADASTRRPRRSRPTAARSSTARASTLAIGEQKTTVYADPSSSATPGRSRSPPHDIFGVDARRSTRELVEQEEPVRLHRAVRRSDRRGPLPEEGLRRVGSYPEELRTYPQDTVAAQVLGYAGVDDTGLGGLELQYNARSSPAGPGPRRSCATRRAARST